jgi:hypothetical protein
VPRGVLKVVCCAEGRDARLDPMRRSALAALAAVATFGLLGSLGGIASANGRAPATSTIHFRQGHESDIAAGMTFGLLLSHDGGATWQWMCETAIGYGGVWDPDYSYTSSGALFATTFNGLVVNRNGCTFDATQPGSLFISTDKLLANGDLLYAAADNTDDKIYKSVNDGMLFSTSTTPPGAALMDWYTYFYASPGQSTDVYVASYRFTASTKTLMVFKSADGGASFSSLTVNGITPFTTASVLTIVGADAGGNVYAKLTYPTNALNDVIYKLAPSATSWTQILSKADTISFLVRDNGDLIAATKTLGAWVSTNQGGMWTALTNPPHVYCLAENSAHEIWACTQNYADTMSMIPSDGYGIMKTTDLATWTGVLKYQDIAGPVDCAAGTPQHDSCVGMSWCGLRTQLGITANPVDCSATTDAPADAAGSGTHVSPAKGCCDTGSGAAAPILAGLLVGGILVFRRRRC